MRDPFPFAAPLWLQKATAPFADYLDLSTLHLHIHEILLAAIFYHIVQTRFSPWISAKLCPKYYNGFSARTRLNWDVHVVSFVQSVVVCILGLWIMYVDDERRDQNHEERTWGYSGGTGLVQAVALGYFVWDLYITARHLSMFGIGMLLHAMSAITVYSFGFRPFVNYYSPDFILYELSSPFLNIHWFCDKLDLTGSTYQLINGIFLITTFISARLIWGSWASFWVNHDIFFAYRRASAAGGSAGSFPFTKPGAFDPEVGVMRYAGKMQAPLWLCVSYFLSNATLNVLNWYWINKMIATIRKRFDPPFGTKVPDKEEMETDVARGIYANGSKSVEVDATKVRRRPTPQRTLTELQMG